MAALLATGPGAVLSHRSAGSLWGIFHSVQLELTVCRSRRKLSRITLHQSMVPEDERTIERRIPVTSVPRTLLDLAAVLPKHQVERAVNQAEVHRLTDLLSLSDLVARYPRRRGSATIKSILTKLEPGQNVTRSELESRFLALLDAEGLPRPEVNASLFVGGRWLECDCVWRSQRLVVELDGRSAHLTIAAFEHDRARDRSLHAEGWRAVRITWRQLHDQSRSVAADLLKMLDAL
jgi:very-short-patch-repair endonuclease